MSILTTDAQSITHLTTPFRGRPTTRTYTNRKDEPEIAVEARALTPLRARLTHYAALLAATSMALVSLAELIFGTSTTLQGFLVLLALTAATYPALRFGLRQLVQIGARVTINPENIIVTRMFRTRCFQRAYPHAFVLHGHDKTEKEKDRHALLDRKHPPRWCSLPRHKYYGNSFHVVLECFGERHDILTVYGLKKATAIHARLKACDAVMDGIGFSDSGVALTPGSDWNVDAGGL